MSHTITCAYRNSYSWFLVTIALTSTVRIPYTAVFFPYRTVAKNLVRKYGKILRAVYDLVSIGTQFKKLEPGTKSLYLAPISVSAHGSQLSPFRSHPDYSPTFPMHH
ncbi:hypothetical protein BT96DRAFT_947860 [Gymnopus androsaceus JB14]|uniref:Uncharacterized protein n=1 Tax=Gymnopus androsaceus JB14 TaxID=1447944 RepID=A0A6A4GQR3_9AGAR|nr:hypothetical protein BT96DRAFT_947860 [Gymnopus androsaceus JB14]